MRIISGKLKGRSIEFLKNINTRPLKDSVKENIFNILEHSKKINIKIENSNILDLYSGIGSFGLEAISRGAKKVTFIDQNVDAINILKKNLDRFLIKDKARVLNEKIENFFRNVTKEKFDIFFFDPPFSDKAFTKFLNLTKNKKVFTSYHIIIIHREKISNDNLKGLVRILDTKISGRSKIIFGQFL